MKKTLILLLAILCLTLAGCGSAGSSAPAASASDIPSATSAAPSSSPAALLGPYSINTAAIYNALHKAVYNAADYYGKDQMAWVSDLSEGDGALYFIECAGLASGVSCGCDIKVEDATCSLVRIGGDGSDRQVLYTVSSDRLLDIQPFAGQVFFATGTDTDISIGYIPETGGEPTLLSLPSEDSGAACYDASLTLDDSGLLITMRYCNETAAVSTDLSWRVDDTLAVTPAA